MSISADKVRELCSRHESASLDFKEGMYDWANDGNNELSKDLMAMANCLARGAAPAYILIGVKERADGTGEIVGVRVSAHLNDATFQQKVSELNRRPDFSYAPVDVDGLSVGVFEIRASGRPFYALRDKGDRSARHKLLRFMPMYRSGSSTDVASPDMVIEWARADDPEVHTLRRRELAKLEAEAAVKPKFYTVSRNGAGEGFMADGILENTGLSDFIVKEVRVTLQWNERFHAAVKATPDGKVPDGYEPPTFEVVKPRGEVVKPGAKLAVQLTYRRAEAFVHFAAAGVLVAGFEGRWANYNVRAVCEGVFGDAITREWLIEP